MIDTATPSKAPARWLPFATLAAAIFLLSTGAVFVRTAQAEGVPSLVVAVLRYTFAATILVPFVATRHQPALRRLSARDLRSIVLAGMAFSLSLFFFFLSLENATVLIANLFTNTHPLWVAVLEVLLLSAVLSRRVWVGITLALIGGGLFTVSGMEAGASMGPNPLLGVVFAFVSAFLATAYFLVGRVVRARVGTLIFLSISLLTGVATLMTVVFLTRTSLTGYSLEGYLWIVLVTITGQLIGQGLLTYCLAHLPATFVSVSMLAQVALSAVWAFVAFGENPGLIQLIASGVILVGVGLVITAGSAEASKSHK
ncbi:MAG: hypothetical protein CL610_00105 [Anaerolineaceae bacterium]|nr:hypothetical protein [Anaerolineaceae bacterium]